MASPVSSNASPVPAGASAGEAIRVCLRCRPFSQTESDNGYTRVTKMDCANAKVTITNTKNLDDIKSFTYDAVFDEDSTQAAVYDGTARAIVEAVLSGFNGTVFVYGQTGTGKTFTMQGEPNVPELCGVIPNAFRHIFSHIARTPERQFLVRVSFLEIYNEDIRDLLANSPAGAQTSATPPPLEIKDAPPTRGGAPGGVMVKNLQSVPVQSVDDMMRQLLLGNKRRSVAQTLMNAASSRSHAVFSVTVESGDSEGHIWAGRLHLVDLAGSERQSKTGAVGDRLKEAAKINLSLSALSNCIAALAEGRAAHIPYRDSKLTRLLQDSLGGNSKTVMIATLSPASYNFDESLSTLRYANRAKNIKNKPTVNEDPTDALLRGYQEEIKKLQELLRQKAQPAKQGGSDSITGPKSDGVSSPRQQKSTKSAAKPGIRRSQSPNANDDSAAIEKMKAALDEEKRELLESSDAIKEEKNRLVADLESRLKILEEERRQKQELQKQLEEMEAKLLVGGVNIFDHVNQQEAELERRRIEKQEEEAKQRELRRALEQQQEANTLMEGEYASLQEEVDVKTRKLQRLWRKMDAVRSEMNDLSDEWNDERAELAASVRELVRERDLRALILETFVSEKELRRAEELLEYDEEADEWKWRLIVGSAKFHAVSGSKQSPKRVTSAGANRVLRSAVSPVSSKRQVCLTAKVALARNRLVRYLAKDIIEVPLLRIEDSTHDVILNQYFKTRPPDAPTR